MVIVDPATPGGDSIYFYTAKAHMADRSYRSGRAFSRLFEMERVPTRWNFGARRDPSRQTARRFTTVRKKPLADVHPAKGHVRFTPESRHVRLLLADVCFGPIADILVSASASFRL